MLRIPAFSLFYLFLRILECCRRRWVEWRLDKDTQTEGDKHRVQGEWMRFNRTRGRSMPRLVRNNALFVEVHSGVSVTADFSLMPRTIS